MRSVLAAWKKASHEKVAPVTVHCRGRVLRSEATPSELRRLADEMESGKRRARITVTCDGKVVLQAALPGHIRLLADKMEKLQRRKDRRRERR
jgi:hypothetical protein